MTNLLLPLNLQFFAENDDAETQQDAQQVDETPENAGESTSEALKSFTQAELDEIVAKRLDRERKKYADYDEVKTKASEYESKLEEQRLAELSEKERAEALAQKYEAEKQELANKLDALQKANEKAQLHAAFTKAATSAGIAYIDDAIALSDLNALTIEENGEINGLDELIAGLVENKPFLLAQEPQKQQPIGNAAQTAKVADKTAEQLLKDAAEKVRATGRTEDRVAYAKLKRELGL